MFHLPFKFIENKGCNIMSTQVSPLEFAAVTREALEEVVLKNMSSDLRLPGFKPALLLISLVMWPSLSY